MSKRTLAVSFLTAGLTAGLVAGAIGPAAAQGHPVGGSGNVYYLSGAGSTGGTQDVLVFGDPGDEVFFGDWNDDGYDTPMVRRNGVFFVADRDGKTVDVFAYGNPDDQVLVGDWDGKKGDSIAVVRPGNVFLVKNDVKKSGTADAEFVFGNPGDSVLVGDWDGDDIDTLLVYRPDTSFHVSNDNGSGKTDYIFTFGDPGDVPIAGDWADPENAKSGNGADQIGLKRGVNHFFLSNELGEGVDHKTAMRDFPFGDAGDTVFTAALPTEGAIDAKRAETYAANVQAEHKKGERVLGVNADGNVIQATGELGPKVYAGGEAKVQLAGAPQYHHGEVVMADGKPVVYAATKTVDVNAVGDYDLNPDGSLQYAQEVAGLDPYVPVRYVAAGDGNGRTTTSLPAGALNQVVVNAGDPVLYRSGQPTMLPIGTPAVYSAAATGDLKAGDKVTNPVIVRGKSGDYKLDTNGNLQGTPGAWTTYGALNIDAVFLDEDGAETVTPTAVVAYEEGAAVLARPGQVVYGYKWNDLSSKWVGQPIVNDEEVGVYVAAGTPDGKNTSKKVADLDTDKIDQPVVYKGGEQVPNFVETSSPASKGGEAVVAHAKGEVKLSTDGDIVIVGTGEPISITGDGLGVRRNFG